MMGLSDTLQRLWKDSERLKTFFSEYLCEIQRIETTLVKQIETEKKHYFPFSNKTEWIDCYDKNGNKIIVYYYGKVAGNRERAVLLTADIVIRGRYKAGVSHSASYSDCLSVEMFDNRLETEIKKVTVLLNSDGAAIDYIYEMLVDCDGEKIRRSYNADGVLLPYYRDESVPFQKLK